MWNPSAKMTEENIVVLFHDDGILLLYHKNDFSQGSCPLKKCSSIYSAKFPSPYIMSGHSELLSDRKYVPNM